MIINKRNFMMGVLSFFILFTPLLKYYNFPGTSFSMETLMLCLGLLFMLIANNRYSPILRHRDIYELKPYFLMFAIVFILTFIFDFLVNDDNGQFYIVLALAVSTLEIYCMQRFTTNNRDFFDSFKKIYITVCVVLSFVTIAEEFLYITTGMLIPMKFSFLPLNEEMAALGYRFGYNGRGGYVGFSPFFSEPAHMSQYMLPALLLLLADENKKHDRKNTIFMILIEVAIVLSTSTYGILASGVMIVFYLVIGKTNAAKRLRKIVLLFLPVMIIVFAYFIKGRLFYDTTSATSIMSSDKTAYRLFRGFMYYAQFPFINKAFGVGFNNFTSFIQAHNLHYAYEIISDKVVSEYLNGFSQALIYGGIITFILFIVFLVRLYRNGTSESKTLVVGFILLMLNASTFLRGTSVFYILIILMLKNQSLNNGKENV
jgi:hypothetical protein